MRWVLLLIAIVGFFGAFLARTPGILGLCLALGFIGALGTVFAVAQARIEGSARPETLNEVDMNALKATLPTELSTARDRTHTPS